MKYLRLHSEQGFTLLELLVSVVILSATVMSMFMIFTQVIRETHRAKNRTIATNVAQMMMERLVSSPHPLSKYDGLRTNDPTLSPLDPVHRDVLDWRAAMKAFPTQAVGAISATATTYPIQSLRFDVTEVEIQVMYGDYGGERTHTLSVTLLQD